jgi:catechol 2,3-dioxygenase-like lactoylglutathione lyase family enzyme
LIPTPNNSFLGKGLERKRCTQKWPSEAASLPETMVTRKQGETAMQDMTAIEVKAFVPSKDFALSKRFYQDLGFNLGWSSDELAYLHHGNSSFLLQNFYVKEHADNFMMHLLVESVEAWWGHVQDNGLAVKYGVKVDPPEDRPWGIRDFVVVDPTGVLWRIGQTIKDTHQEIAG